MDTIEYFRIRNKLLIEHERKLKRLASLQHSLKKQQLSKYNSEFYSKLNAQYNKLEVCRFSGEPLNK